MFLFFYNAFWTWGLEVRLLRCVLEFKEFQTSGLGSGASFVGCWSGGGGLGFRGCPS